MMLTGNRLGFAAVYVLLNFLSLLFLWFGKTIFMPLLFGIRIPEQPFILFCPTYNILQMNGLVDVNIKGIDTMGEYISFSTNDSDFTVTLQNGWSYVLICSAIGIAMMGLALVLYRKRKLETAGDFIAYKSIEPVFIVLFTLGVGGFFQLFSEMFGYGAQYLFLAVGIIVGFFGCLMLLQKTTRVFSLRAFRNLAIFAICLGVILDITKLDPLGLTRKIPDTEDVDYISVGKTYASAYNMWDEIILRNPEDIETIRNIHQYAIEHQDTYNPDPEDDVYYLNIGIDYILKNGKILSRYYSIPVGTSAADELRPIFSRIECVTRGMSEEEFLALENRVYMIYSDGVNYDISRDMDISGLLEAIVADCKTGAMVQYAEYHYYDTNDMEYKNDPYLEIGYNTPEGVSTGMWITVYEDCVNTLSWLEEYNMLP